MKLKLILPILFFFAFVQPTFAASIHSIKLAVDPDNSTTVTVTHNFAITGESDDNLANGVNIELPFTDAKVVSASINSVNSKFSQDGSLVRINFGTVLLKNDQTADIKIQYVTNEVLTNFINYAIIKFPNPTPGSNFKIEIVNKSSSYHQVFSSSNDSNITKIDEYSSILEEKNNSNSLSYELFYANTEDKFLYPIVSDNFGKLNKITSKTGTNLGYIDNTNNYYLISEDLPLVIKGDLIQLNKHIDTFPFKDDSNLFNSFQDLVEFLDSKQINELLSIKNTDINSIKKQSDLNSLDFALLSSRSLSNLDIPNQLLYGKVIEPNGHQFLHFWVEYLDGSEIKVLDEFTKIKYDSDDYYPIRLPFGIIDQSTIDNLDNILYIDQSHLKIFLNQTQEIAINPEESFIDIYRNGSITNALFINNSDYFLSFSNSDDELLNKQLEGLLVLPHSQTQFPVITGNANNKQVSIEVDYKIGNNSFIKMVEINFINDFREFYAKIALVIFSSGGILIILIRFLYKVLIEDRLFFRYRNKLTKRYRSFKHRNKVK